MSNENTVLPVQSGVEVLEYLQEVLPSQLSILLSGLKRVPDNKKVEIVTKVIKGLDETVLLEAIADCHKQTYGKL